MAPSSSDLHCYPWGVRALAAKLRQAARQLTGAARGNSGWRDSLCGLELEEAPDVERFGGRERQVSDGARVCAVDLGGHQDCVAAQPQVEQQGELFETKGREGWSEEVLRRAEMRGTGCGCCAAATKGSGRGEGEQGR